MREYIAKNIEQKSKEIMSESTSKEKRIKVFSDYLKWKIMSWATDAKISMNLISNGESPESNFREKLLAADFDRRNSFLTKCKICLKEVPIDVLIQHSELCLRKVRIKEDIDKKKQEIAKFYSSANENMRNNQLAKRLEM